jgi:hypothetical protein
MARLMPNTAMRLVMRLLKVTLGKLLMKMPVLVKMTAMVMMMERSLMASEAPAWGGSHLCSAGR